MIMSWLSKSQIIFNLQVKFVQKAEFKRTLYINRDWKMMNV